MEVIRGRFSATEQADFDGLMSMLETVAMGMEITPAERGLWIVGIRPKLNEVGVYSLKDFVRSVLIVNHKLAARRYPQIQATTLEHMFNVACDLVFAGDFE